MPRNKQILDLDWLVKKYLSFLQQFGMNEDNIRSYFIVWSKNRHPLIKDYLWFIFQQLLIESTKQSHSASEIYRHQITIYSEMLSFRRRVEKVKANEILQLLLEAEVLKAITDTDLKLDVKINSGYCCPYCDSLNNKNFAVDDILENKYLGSNNCTNQFGCNCTYSFIPLRNEDGSLK